MQHSVLTVESSFGNRGPFTLFEDGRLEQAVTGSKAIMDDMLASYLSAAETMRKGAAKLATPETAEGVNALAEDLAHKYASQVPTLAAEHDLDAEQLRAVTAASKANFAKEMEGMGIEREPEPSREL